MGPLSHSLLGPAVLVDAAPLWKGRGLLGRPRRWGRVLRVPVAPATWCVEAEHVLWSRGAGSARAWSPPASRCSPIPTAASTAGAGCAAPLPSGAKLNWLFLQFRSRSVGWEPVGWGSQGGWRWDQRTTVLTPGYTGTDVFPPRFTVRPSFRISKFRPRAPGSPPAGRGAVR